MIFFSKNGGKDLESFQHFDLKIGRHQYSHGDNVMIVEIYPVLTFRALCYKLNYLVQMPDEIVYLIISSPEQGIDKLEGISWYVAANNTWQGAITRNWPYNNIPQEITVDFKQDYINYIHLKLREDIWKYREDNLDFDLCVDQEQRNKKSRL